MASDGSWQLRVSNTTSLAVTGVRVRVDYIDGNGTARSFERNVGRIDPGRHQQVPFPREIASVQRARGAVIAATISP